ncbi:hypothetical protein PIB30_012403 [Stylosanthes scabra]|uniref:DUF4283 domain-containing protein n=1 Tax=Stylosanthes scabra TaxID=79078 RepID=A0ABU6R6T4_9FABA|nr:hypothetical protein [Stylosanthes scabra]
MGIPIHAWSIETFENIAKQWGKLVMVDDRTEQCWSYSVARFLIDCFEWGRINEWFDLKFPASEDDGISKNPNVILEPEIEESLTKELEMMNDVNGINGGGSKEVETMMHEEIGILNVDNQVGDIPMCQTQLNVNVDLEVDQVNYVAQTEALGDQANLEGNETQPNQSWDMEDTISSESISYPPGFGPDLDASHVLHKDHSHSSSLRGVEHELETNIANPNLNLGCSDNSGTGRKEAIKAKEICEKECISFKSRNEDDLLVRLVGAKAAEPEERRCRG